MAVTPENLKSPVGLSPSVTISRSLLYCVAAFGLFLSAAIFSGSLVVCLILLFTAAAFLAPSFYTGGTPSVFALVIGLLGALIPGFVAAIFNGGELQICLVMLMAPVCALTMAMVLRKTKSFTTSIFAATAVAAGMLFAAFLWLLFQRFGGVGKGALDAFFQSVEEQLTEALRSFYSVYKNNLSFMVESGSIDNASAEQLLSQLPSDALIADSMKNLITLTRICLPGFLGAFCWLLCYGSGKLFLRLFGQKARNLSERERGIAIDGIGGVLFYVSALFTVFLGAEGGIGAVAINLFLLYLLPFTVMGARDLFSRERIRNRSGIFLIVAVVALSLFNPLAFPLLLSVFGASKSISDAIAKKKNKQ